MSIAQLSGGRAAPARRTANIHPDGIKVRRATGTEVAAAMVCPPCRLVTANCTDSGWSPGLAGKATSSGTGTLA